MFKRIFLLFLLFSIPINADTKITHSPTKAFILSGLFPGAGQYYNKKYIKSISFFSVETISLGLSIFYNNKYKETGEVKYFDRRNKFIPIFIMTWAYSLLDAYVDAHFFFIDQKKISIISKENIIYCRVNFKF